MQSENKYWNDYPRPQLRRELYMILNGEWKLNGSRIVVPFPPQSKLSEYNKNPLEVEQELVYECDFKIPVEYTKDRILLHFGAVDQVARVYVNGNFVGKHEGGYLPFSIDITSYISKLESNSLKVEVEDYLLKDYPYGKQCNNRGGMWYTPVSGIWQTVWIENVPANYVENILITSGLNGVDIMVNGVKDGFSIFIEDEETDTLIERNFKENNGRIELADFNKPVFWSMDNPKLYYMKIRTAEDEVTTYFAFRQIEIIKMDGVNRVCLNGKPIFLHGVLDQGYFYDGLYLPKESSEYEKDIIRMKELGFNTLRKHIKIEPELFYYYCDKLGMMVVQDMVNSGPYSFIKDTALPTIGFKKCNDIKRRDKSNANDTFRKMFFEQHMKDTIFHLYNHPSIIAYTIFNEGWGQFESDRMYEVAKKCDSTRLYDSTSGWFWGKQSDFDSEHVYFRNKNLKPKIRPMYLSECGGFTYKVDNHCFNPDKSYGYGTCRDELELTDRIINMYNKMVIPAIRNGLCGAVYTQLSDIEDEINGLYTYDRESCKVDKDKLKTLAKKLIL